MEVESMRRRLSRLKDDELLRVLGAERADYRREALDLAAAELTRRGVPLPLPAPEAAPPARGVRTSLEQPASGAAWAGLKIVIYVAALAAAFEVVIKSGFWAWPPGLAGWLSWAGCSILLGGVMALLERRLMAEVKAFQKGLDDET